MFAIVKKTLFLSSLTVSSAPRCPRRAFTAPNQTVSDAPRGTVLKGVASAPGVYKGKACILHELAEGRVKFKKGDVLVVKMADSEWNDIILQSGALVVEMGGEISHGPMVARRYGIPCVSELGEKMWDSINDGKLLLVNGKAGTVEVLPK